MSKVKALYKPYVPEFSLDLEASRLYHDETCAKFSEAHARVKLSQREHIIALDALNQSTQASRLCVVALSSALVRTDDIDRNFSDLIDKIIKEITDDTVTLATIENVTLGIATYQNAKRLSPIITALIPTTLSALEDWTNKLTTARIATTTAAVARRALEAITHIRHNACEDWNRTALHLLLLAQDKKALDEASQAVAEAERNFTSALEPWLSAKEPDASTDQQVKNAKSALAQAKEKLAAATAAYRERLARQNSTR